MLGDAVAIRDEQRLVDRSARGPRRLKRRHERHHARAQRVDGGAEVRECLQRTAGRGRGIVQQLGERRQLPVHVAQALGPERSRAVAIRRKRLQEPADLHRGVRQVPRDAPAVVLLERRVVDAALLVALDDPPRVQLAQVRIEVLWRVEAQLVVTGQIGCHLCGRERHTRCLPSLEQHAHDRLVDLRARGHEEGDLRYRLGDARCPERLGSGQCSRLVSERLLGGCSGRLEFDSMRRR